MYDGILSIVLNSLLKFCESWEVLIFFLLGQIAPQITILLKMFGAL